MPTIHGMSPVPGSRCHRYHYLLLWLPFKLSKSHTIIVTHWSNDLIGVQSNTSITHQSMPTISAHITQGIPNKRVEEIGIWYKCLVVFRTPKLKPRECILWIESWISTEHGAYLVEFILEMVKSGPVRGQTAQRLTTNHQSLTPPKLRIYTPP